MPDYKKMKEACPNIKANMAGCTCSYSACDKTGLCCQCVAYHRKMGQIPGCFFSSAGERTYDRSYSQFCRDRCGS